MNLQNSGELKYIYAVYALEGGGVHVRVPEGTLGLRRMIYRLKSKYFYLL